MVRLFISYDIELRGCRDKIKSYESTNALLYALIVFGELRSFISCANTSNNPTVICIVFIGVQVNVKSFCESQVYSDKAGESHC